MPISPHGTTNGDRVPAPLDAAFSGAFPGTALPPGPRMNAWAAVGAVQEHVHGPLGDLLPALWRAGELHRNTDGTSTKIRRRPVPSAGACYGVQTHIVSADGTRRIFDTESVTLWRRDAARDLAAGWPVGTDTNANDHLVFTVLPGRTFGRYRHRAWPLWIADVAYAVAAVRFLLTGRAGAEHFGPSTRLRALLGVPPAADTEAWMRRGLVPEIPLAAVELSGEPEVHPERVRALRARRSPSLIEFLERAELAPPPAAVETVARASGQTWVRGASSVRSWSIPRTASTSEIGTALWSAHLSAAGQCYTAALSGTLRTRPVSGFTPVRDRWILHALATIPTSGGHP